MKNSTLSLCTFVCMCACVLCRAERGARAGAVPFRLRKALACSSFSSCLCTIYIRTYVRVVASATHEFKLMAKTGLNDSKSVCMSNVKYDIRCASVCVWVCVCVHAPFMCMYHDGKCSKMADTRAYSKCLRKCRSPPFSARWSHIGLAK